MEKGLRHSADLRRRLAGRPGFVLIVRAQQQEFKMGLEVCRVEGSTRSSTSEAVQLVKAGDVPASQAARELRMNPIFLVAVAGICKVL